MTLLLIHAGGTIGMIQTSTGFAPAPGVVEDHIRDHIASGELPPVDIRLLEPLIDSANATPEDWDRIARIVHAEHDRYDAFVVTHGTDTLAYTSAALCYALEGLVKPVILTGSMLPLTVEGSDGPRNLRDAMKQAGTAPPGVRVQFAGRLLHGARTRKTHSRNLDAFAADPSDVAPRRPGSTLQLHSPAVADIAVLAVAGIAATGVAAFSRLFTGRDGQPPPDHGWIGFLAGTALCILAYKGFTTITNQGGDIANPKKNVGRSIMISILLCAVLYLLLAGSEGTTS